MTRILACPDCKLPLLENASDFHVSRGLACRGDCRPLTASENLPVNTHYLDVPARRGTISDRVDAFQEASIVSDIQKGLQERGWVVVRVGQKRAKGAGNSVGAPDLAIRNPVWPDGVLLGLEVKRPGGRLSNAQMQLQARGCFKVVTSLEEAIACVEELCKLSDVGYNGSS